MQYRYLKDLEGSPEVTLRLRPITVHTRVFKKDQTEKAPLSWDKTRAVREVLPSDQYIVRVQGSGRISRRNGKLLQADVSVPEEEGSRFPYGQDIGMGREVDSTWGARGHMTQSAD